MRSTSPSAALPVAAAAIPLVAAVLVPLAVPSTALAERWLRPVPGEVVRPFDYTAATPFARGAHRGVDFAAVPGTAVRAACAGRVVHAGPVAGGDGVVSIRCGDRRVSYLPVGGLAVRAGTAIERGARIATVSGGHGGLHLGVRREGDRFAYEDPLALLAPLGPGPTPPAAAPRRPTAPRLAPAPPRPAPTAPSRPSPSMPPLPLAGAGTHAPRPGPAQQLAPWPVWLGVALLLSGAAGSGTIVVRRRRRAGRHALVTATQSTR